MAGKSLGASAPKTPQQRVGRPGTLVTRGRNDAVDRGRVGRAGSGFARVRRELGSAQDRSAALGLHELRREVRPSPWNAVAVLPGVSTVGTVAHGARSRAALAGAPEIGVKFLSSGPRSSPPDAIRGVSPRRPQTVPRDRVTPGVSKERQRCRNGGVM